MTGLMAYSGITTKIRAMQKNLLTDAQFREITSLPDVPSIVSWLKKVPSYADVLSHLDENNLHRGQIEFEIGNATYSDFASIYQFANGAQRKFLREYGRRFEVKLLKRCMNAAINGSQMTPDIKVYKDFFDHYTELDLDALYEAKDIRAVIDALKGTHYYEPLNRISQNPGMTLFDYETALDQYYFAQIWDDRGGMKTKLNTSIITKIFGTKIDMLNLIWINRARNHYHMSAADMYAMLIPISYKLKKEEVQALVEADSSDAYESALKKTYFGRVYKNYMAPENLGSEYNYVLRHILNKLSREDPYSVATLHNYLYLKEHEIARLTIAVECVRYGMPSDEAMKLILAL
ncbi:MAG: V-type ATPase subunit [Lachnospiraceae bacterium]|jgi:V/A-type H+-transporting ATPase subunit C|nr:V-type ATPase subunit [Lachnospiraceae bacterium]